MSDQTKTSRCAEDLNEFVDLLSESNDLMHIADEVSPRFEIGAVLKLLGEKEGPAGLFTNVTGFSCKVAGNVMGHERRLAKALGVSPIDLKRVYLERKDQRVPPTIVKKAPVQQVRLEKDEVNLLDILPALVHHEQDSSPYLTSAVTCARDPKTGGQSMGIHRVQIQSENQMAICLNNPPLAHFLRNGKEMKSPMDVAVVIGPDPLVLLAAVSSCPEGTHKIDIAGAFRRKPVEMVRCETVDVLVPASAQFVIEGTIDSEETAPEGLFGDSSGTYVEALSPVIRVTGLSHREDPIYQALQPWSREDDTLFNLCFGSGFLAQIRNEHPFIKDLQLIGGTVGGHVVFSVKDAPKPKIRSAIAALLANHTHAKMVIAVDEDIDIHNIREVHWAVATRFQADRDLLLIPEVQGSMIDPSISVDGASCKMGIDATFPKDRLGKFEKIRIPVESRNRARAIVEKATTIQELRA